MANNGDNAHTVIAEGEEDFDFQTELNNLQTNNINLYNNFNNLAEAIKVAINTTIAGGAFARYQEMYNTAVLLTNGTTEEQINERYASRPAIRDAVIAFFQAKSNLSSEENTYLEGILGLLFRVAHSFEAQIPAHANAMIGLPAPMHANGALGAINGAVNGVNGGPAGDVNGAVNGANGGPAGAAAGSAYIPQNPSAPNGPVSRRSRKARKTRKAQRKSRKAQRRSRRNQYFH